MYLSRSAIERVEHISGRKNTLRRLFNIVQTQRWEQNKKRRGIRRLTAGAGPLPKPIQYKIDNIEYTATHELEKGMGGEVLKGTNVLGQEVVLKIAKKETRTQIHSFRKEKEIYLYLKQMKEKHKNILTIKQIHEDDKYGYLVFPYMKGGDALDMMNQQNLYKCRLRMFYQIVDAMAFAHANNIAHLDIKMENILLDEQNNAIVCDWGLSKIFTSNDDSISTTQGTKQYLCPEIIFQSMVKNSTKPEDRQKPFAPLLQKVCQEYLTKKGNSNYSAKKADVWALGVLFCHLIFNSGVFHDWWTQDRNNLQANWKFTTMFLFTQDPTKEKFLQEMEKKYENHPKPFHSFELEIKELCREIIRSTMQFAENDRITMADLLKKLDPLKKVLFD